MSLNFLRCDCNICALFGLLVPFGTLCSLNIVWISFLVHVTCFVSRILFFFAGLLLVVCNMLMCMWCEWYVGYGNVAYDVYAH